MYWAGEKAGAGVSGGGGAGEGHSSIGVTSPANTWYLPEGSSAWGFECWLLIQNPGSGEAHCQVTYMIEGAQPVTVTKVIPPGTRRSFNMADDIGTADASIKVASDVPVVPERSMYRDNRREGSNSIGTTAPAEDYYLSEGTTAWGFTTYVLVQNPNPVPANVTVTYMTPSGSFATAPRTIPAGSRKTIKVNDEAPNTDLSVKVHGSQPIIAERAMYWDGAGGEACHDSIGLDAPHRVFLLPGGLAGQFGQQWFETWTLVQNPNDVDVKVRVSYLTDGAKSNTTFDAVVRANSRMSFNMGDKLAAGRAGVLVECLTPGRKIMAERSTYWNGRGSGVCTIGGFSD